MAIININEENYYDEIKDGLVLVDFWAPWCGPCKMVGPVLEELDEVKGDSLKILKVDVDENKNLANEYNIYSVPTLILIKDGEIVAKDAGFKPLEHLVEWVDKHN